ncbi:MAG: hypothetical protein WBN42_06280 [Ignavibacteriaceae bacterium]
MNSIYKIKILFVILFIGFLFSSCTNPFAPKYDDNIDSGDPPISDQTTIEGVFQNFQYAYTFKDTLIYGNLITSDFTFTYRDYENGYDVNWGRDEDMQTTNGLFQNSERLDLIWNNIVLSTIDSLDANIIRSFNLNITFNPTDVVRIDGRVNLSLRQDPDSKKWYITRWLDESNF